MLVRVSSHGTKNLNGKLSGKFRFLRYLQTCPKFPTHLLCKGYMKAMLKMHGRTSLKALTTRPHLGYELAIRRALREFLQIDKPKVGKIQMRSEDVNRFFLGWHGSRQFLVQRVPFW